MDKMNCYNSDEMRKHNRQVIWEELSKTYLERCRGALDWYIEQYNSNIGKYSGISLGDEFKRDRYYRMTGGRSWDD